MPPSIESLEERLRLRETETPESIARRMSKASHELVMSKEFDVILHNTNLEQALKKAEEIVKEFLAK
jgi:guanylate kinase